MPVSAQEEPQPFKVNYSIAGLTLGDAVAVEKITQPMTGTILEAVAPSGTSADSATGWSLVAPSLPSQWLSLPDLSLVGAVDLFGGFTSLGAMAASLLVFAILLSVFFDAMGTSVGLATEAGTVDRQGNIYGMNRVLAVDALRLDLDVRLAANRVAGTAVLHGRLLAQASRVELDLHRLTVTGATARAEGREADEIFVESEKVVNALSDQARIDATKQSEVELEKARGVLTEARQAMTAFRVRTRIVDPTIDLGAQMSVMTALQGQLAEARVAYDTLKQNARAGDQRLIQAERRIASLEGQIEAERAKFGGDDSGDGQNYAQLMADYERLKVDLEFAEGAHQTARVAHEAALASAQRQMRYLAAHIQPTAAQKSLTPDRPWLLAMGAGLAFVLWSIMILVYYSVRDRR